MHYVLLWPRGWAPYIASRHRTVDAARAAANRLERRITRIGFDATVSIDWGSISRAVAASSDAAEFHSAEGGSQPTLPLQTQDEAA